VKLLALMDNPGIFHAEDNTVPVPVVSAEDTTPRIFVPRVIWRVEETGARDTWWLELRREMRSHMRALGCSVLLGYSEHTSL
ncbi:hypothetical protein NL526_29660, partial [Klebsiella pneumoniae]|nr:hypothetical protein [Klebsiella pneumoniae]